MQDRSHSVYKYGHVCSSTEKSDQSNLLCDTDKSPPLPEFIACRSGASHNGYMIFVLAGLLGIALVVFCPVLEELLARLME